MNNQLSSVMAGRFTCPACDARFHTIGDKRRHLHSEHPKKGEANG